MKYTIVFILSLIALMSFGQDYELWWSDEFDSDTVNTENWTLVTGDGCPNLCGWGNNELEWYLPQNATVNNGILTITAKEENAGGYDYTSSRMNSKDKVEFTFGKVQARIKMPEGQGLWPAFWLLYATPENGGWPTDGEIDIVELVGHQPDIIHGTIHYGPSWPNNKQYGGSYSMVSGDFSDDFHTYSITWDADRIRWYVDSMLYFTADPDDVFPYDWPFNKDFFIILNCAVGGNWPGAPDATTVFPQTMEVDYVRVYKDANVVSVPSLTLDESLEIKLSSNPMKNDGRIFIGSESTEQINLEVYDLKGSAINNDQFTITPGGGWYPLGLTDALPGTYFVRLSNRSYSWTEIVVVL